MGQVATLIQRTAGIALAIIVLASIMATARAEPRIALVIGNAAYKNSPLRNPVNDARLIGQTLRAVGFEVIERTDLDQNGMKRVIQEFGLKLEGAGRDAVGLFYYSGHGVQAAGRNFLIPTTANIARASDLDIDAVDANWVMAQMAEAGNRLNFVILDACRDNPFTKGFKSAQRGLSVMQAPTGTLIAYATSPDDVAADGEGTNSPYTAALAAALPTQGVPAEQVFKRVRNRVLAETSGQQTPWESSSLVGADFYFAAPSGAVLPPSAPAQEAMMVPPASSGEKVARILRDCPECPEMVAIPAGSFMMGSPPSEERRGEDEGPVHQVSVTSFAVGKYEVTFEEWDACVSAGICEHRPDDEDWGRDRRPVIGVSWDDAQQYVAWLSRKTGKRYRLLSEAEWEYAARAGTQTAYYWGDNRGDACTYANVADLTGAKKHNWSQGDNIFQCRDHNPYTAPVGSFVANAFGLYDTLGNAWEWTADCYHSSYSGTPSDGKAWSTANCGARVARGGSWSNEPGGVRSALRFSDDTGKRYSDLGFRVARDL